MSIAEAAPEQNLSGRSPLTQGSNIPLGWVPSEAKPVPVVRCVQIKKDGNRCGRWSLRGYTKCKKHAGPGAGMPDGNVNVYREAIIEAGRLRLIDEVDPSIDVLVDLMQPGTAEAIRLKAAESVLDRAGLRGGFDFKVEVEHSVNPADTLAERLSKLTAGAQAVKKIRESRNEDDPDADVVDGELVEDDGQLTIFDALAEEELS